MRANTDRRSIRSVQEHAPCGECDHYRGCTFCEQYNTHPAKEAGRFCPGFKVREELQVVQAV